MTKLISWPWPWVLVCCAAPALAADSLESALSEIQARNGLPALGVAYLQDGKLSRAAVVGVRKYGDPTPVQTDDQFHLGSCTKAMTATLVGLAIDEGKLRWTSTLAELFPELGESLRPEFKPVTVEMLSAQWSGITGDLAGFGGGRLWAALWNEALDPVEGRKLVVRELLTAPPASAPGSRFEYSNANYLILGAIVEKLAGEPWESLIRKKLFVPLEMTTCGFGAAGDPDAASPDQPWGHTDGPTGLVPHRPDFRGDNPPTVHPAGGVHCSMADWGKFLVLHLRGFNGQSTFLKPETFQKLHTPHPGQEYTYGGWIRTERAWAGGPVLTHNGSNTLSSVVVWLAPRKDAGFLSVMNYGGKRADAAGDQAISKAIALLLPKPPLKKK